ncbi:MAG: biotin--[acetyl-CoA-carboxylase] ligase [Gammaproteobacteria bacterium]|jgi:BirA family biotin operon repressor/biotin-[acetyl-CoA-carboxylase] ligase|nr:biotin--[acetyl-CoA-carboxylase] ligase [Gammaproteobacteria bacterium]|tara:strand:+ start:2911 stop:3708 length:798 start_codon:yes stop_codon:yes gene_type:complete
MNAKALQKLLAPEVAREIRHIHWHDEIDSTNQEAIRKIQSGELDRALIIADCQTHGRGRRGREWISTAAGIYMSLVWPVQGSSAELQGLSLVTALSVKSAMQESGINGLKLKWPNDVLHEGSKLAGILLELQSGSWGLCLVIGIGVNICLDQAAQDKIDRPATGINSIAGSHVDKNAIIAAMLDTLVTNVWRFEADGFGQYQEEWNRSDYFYNKSVIIHRGKSQIRGRSEGVDGSGALILQTANGLELITGGEVFPTVREIAAGS